MLKKKSSPSRSNSTLTKPHNSPSRRALSTKSSPKSSTKSINKPTHALTTARRAMAFSFNKPVSMFQQPAQKATLPWEKHGSDVKITTKHEIRKQQEHQEALEAKLQEREEFEDHRGRFKQSFLDGAQAEAAEIMKQQQLRQSEASQAHTDMASGRPTPVARPRTEAEVQQHIINEQKSHSRHLQLKSSTFSFSSNQHTQFAYQGSLIDSAAAEDGLSTPGSTRGRVQQPPQLPPQQMQQQTKLASNSRFSLTSAVQASTDALARSDVTGVSLTDLEALFKHSKLSGVFAQQQQGPTFWSHANDGETLYFIGTRQIIDKTGQLLDPTFAFLERKVSKQMRQLHDTFTTYDYSAGSPVVTATVTNLEAELNKGTVRETKARPANLSIKTALKLRGVGWKWHSGVMMTRIEEAHVDMSKPKQPDVYNVTRFKFKESGFTAEKVVRRLDTIMATVVDEMKVVPKAEYNLRLDACLRGDVDEMKEGLEAGEKH